MHYSVGVQVFLVDKLSSQMTKVTGSLMKGQKAAGGFGEAMKKLHKVMQGVSALGGVGKQMEHIGMAYMSSVLKPALELEQSMTRMRLQGFSHLETVQATNKAWDTAIGKQKVLGSSVLGNMQVIRDLATAFEDPAKAMKFSSMFAEQQMIMKAILPSEMAKHAEEQTFSGAKALELMGAFAPKDEKKAFALVEQKLTGMRRAMQMTGGRIDFEDYLISLQSSTGMRQWTDKALFQMAPLMMLEQKRRGGTSIKFGTMATAMDVAFMQGRMNKSAAMNLERLGLIGAHAEKLTTSTTGTIVRSGLKGREDLRYNPFEWLEKHVVPAFEKLNPALKTMDEHTKNLKMAQMWKDIGLGINPTRFGESYFAMRELIPREVARYNKTPTGAEARKIAEGSVNVNMQELFHAWDDFKLALGEAVAPAVVDGLKAVTAGIRAVTQVVRNNPELAKMAFAASIALTVVGAILSIGAAFAGMAFVLALVEVPVLTVVGYIAAAVAVVAALAYAIMNWRQIAAVVLPVLNRVWRGIQIVFQKIWDSIPPWGQNAILAILDCFKRILAALNNSWNAVSAWFGDCFKGILPILQANWAPILDFLTNLIPGMAGLKSLFNGAKGLYDIGLAAEKKDAMRAGKANREAGGWGGLGGADDMMGHMKKAPYKAMTINVGEGAVKISANPGELPPATVQRGLDQMVRELASAMGATTGTGAGTFYSPAPVG